MEDTSNTSFFSENERKMNLRVAKLIWLGLFTGPALILGRFSGIFYKLSYRNPLIFTVLLLFIAVFVNICTKKFPYSPKTKYICLISIEFLVCFLAMTKGLCLFLSYLIVPCLSCMYYDEKLTRNISITCYLAMIGTLFYRTFFPVPEFVGNMTQLQWLLAYGTGLTIEYVTCMLIIYTIANSARKTLHNLGDTISKERKTTDMLQERNHKIEIMQQQLISGFANLVESKDPTTGEHIKNTSGYVLLIAMKLRELGFYKNELTDKDIEYMVKAAPLHDLGKIRVADRILCKPGKLTPEEFEVIKKHPAYGERLIKENMRGFEDEHYIQTARDMALYHHEKWDGTGYPGGIKGTAIPLSARIMTVADVYDALRSKRPYKEPISAEETLKIMKAGAGSQFDPAVIKALIACSDEMSRIS